MTAGYGCETGVASAVRRLARVPATDSDIAALTVLLGRSPRGAVGDREAGDPPERKRGPEKAEDIEDADRRESREAQRETEESVADERLGESERVRERGEDVRVEDAGRCAQERVPGPGDAPGLKLRVVGVAEVRAEPGQHAGRPRRGHAQTDGKIDRSRADTLHSGIWMTATGTDSTAFFPVAVFGVSGRANGRGAPLGRSSFRTISFFGTAPL